MHTLVRTVSVLVIGATAVVAGSAHALMRELSFQVNGTGACQAALPSFEGLVRKRPMALQNEGSGTAFVTCSPVTLQSRTTALIGHGIWLLNQSDVNVTIACTAVVGAARSTPQSTVPKSVTIQPGGTNAIYWKSSDGIAENNNQSFNVSCALPPGTGIATLYTNQLLDVGE